MTDLVNAISSISMVLLASLYFYWSVFILFSSLVMNSVTFLFLLKRAGSCLSDQGTPSLLAVTGCHLLHTVMVQVFVACQQYYGHLSPHSHHLCLLLQMNQTALSDVPFPIFCFQLALIIQRMKKKDSSYSHYTLCCSSLYVILCPWVL